MAVELVTFSGPTLLEFTFRILFTAIIFLALYGIGTLLFGPPDQWHLWVLWFAIWGAVEVET